TDGKTAANPANLDEFSAQQNAVFSLDGGIPAGQQHGPAWYAIYRLPLGPAPAGYDITSVDSITGHQDNRSSQTVDIEVQFVGDDAFYSLSNNTNFAYRPDQGNGAGRIRITDDTGGPLARGVRAIRFEADQEAVYRELDVFGTVTPPPTSAPAAPTALGATLQGTDVRLAFTDQANNEAGFRIERATVVGGVTGTFASVAQLGANTTPGQVVFTDTTTQVGQTYEYRVTAFNAFNGGSSSAPVTVTVTTPTAGAGTAARYFGVSRWKGTPIVTQIDPNLSDNVFGPRSPHPLVPVDQFSAIYSGRVTAPSSGVYLFNVTVDDEGYFYLGGGDLGGQFFYADGTTGPGAVALTAGQTYNLVYLASENAGNATFNLTWTLPDPGATPTAIPASMMQSALTPVTVAPSGVAAGTLTANSVEIVFTDESVNEVKYQLERATVTGGTPGPYSIVAEDRPNSGALTDLTANPSTTYSYRVRSFNFEGSVASGPVQVTTPARTPLNGATGAWYDSPFWGLPGRPANQNSLAVASDVDYREEVTEIGFEHPNLDRVGIGTVEGGTNGQGNYSNAFTG
ncbi:MAG TPA: PA14 domain-containing protein, partial [Acidimicrobiales bacterium]|nr:PA14 domain-containing protein [Acidimicrobiales bacterium]